MRSNWRRNLRVVSLAEFFSIMGLSAVIPILPYYIESLGIEGAAVSRWSGIVTAAAAFSMVIMAPIWGIISDRHGRKLMLVRAMFGGALVLCLMGFARNAAQLAFLRFIQGALTGTVTAAMALVASGTPKHRLGETLGKLQLAVFIGQSFGPVTGGAVSDIFGYRAVYWASAAYLIVGGSLILLLVHEQFQPVEQDEALPFMAQMRTNFGLIFSSSLLTIVLGLRFSLRFGLRMTSPLLPLLVKDLNPPAALIGSASGLLSSVSGMSSAVSAPLLGRLADRYGGRQLLLTCGVGSGIALCLQALVSNYWLLLVCQVCVGLAIGGTLAIISSYIGKLAPEGKSGIAYGLDAMAVSLANAVGPLLGGWMGGLQLRSPFFIGGFLMAAAGFAVLLLPQGKIELAMAES